MNYAIEVEGETMTTVTSDSTLPLFGAAESSDGTATFFTGGPVWAMDWLCTRDGQDTDVAGKQQHLVLMAYRDYDEVSKIVYKWLCYVFLFCPLIHNIMQIIATLLLNLYVYLPRAHAQGVK